MKKLIEKLGAFFIALAMILAVFPTQVQAAATAETWFEAGKSAEKGKDYRFVEDSSSHVVSEIQVMTATGLGFVSYLMTGGVTVDGVNYGTAEVGDATIKLMNDIDLAGKQWVGIGGIAIYSGTTQATYTATFPGSSPQTSDYFYAPSAGSNIVDFKGNFNGNDKIISNLTIQRTYSGDKDGTDDWGISNLSGYNESKNVGGYFLGENYFMLNNDGEFKNVTFRDINVQIIDKFVSTNLIPMESYLDDYYRGSATGFGLIMENHGTVSNVSADGNVTILSSMPFYYGLTAINRGTISNAAMNINVDLLLASDSGHQYAGLQSTPSVKLNDGVMRRYALISGIAGITGEPIPNQSKLNGMTTSSIKNSSVRGAYNLYYADVDTSSYPVYDGLEAYKNAQQLFKLDLLNDTHGYSGSLKGLLTNYELSLVSAISGSGYNSITVDSTTYNIQVGADESYTGAAGSLRGKDLSGLANPLETMSVNYTAEPGSKAKLFSTPAEPVVAKTETFTSSVGGVVASAWKRFSDGAATNSIEIPIYLTTAGDISYKVELNWGDMEFVYDRGSYDAEKGETVPSQGNELGWNGNDNTNNLINVINKSNASVNAKLNLQLDKNYSGAFYKEAGADKTGSNEKDYAGKASYAAGTYLALSSAGGGSDSQNFYLVMGGAPNGNLSNAQIGSITVTVTSQTASTDSTKLTAYLSDDTGTTYAVDSDVEVGDVKLIANKTITVADNMTMTLFGELNADGNTITVSNANTSGKLTLHPEFRVIGSAGTVLDSTKMLISGAETLKANGLVWKDSTGNAIADLSTTGLQGDNVKLVYLGSVADYLKAADLSEVYPINSSETVTADVLNDANVLQLNNDAVLTIEGTFTGSGTLQLNAGSNGSVIYNGNTYHGAADTVMIIE